VIPDEVKQRKGGNLAQRVQESVEVQAPAADVFSYWSNFENFSTFMSNVEEVRMTGGTPATGR
jgi:uncharacterized membrane protein